MVTKFGYKMKMKLNKTERICFKLTLGFLRKQMFIEFMLGLGLWREGGWGKGEANGLVFF